MTEALKTHDSPFTLLRPILQSFFIECLLLVVPATSSAQVTILNDQTSTPVAGAGHTYIGGLQESVNPENGTLSIRIPIPLPSGRGLSPTFGLSYDSGTAHFVSALPNYSTTWLQGAAPITLADGWSYSLPGLTRGVSSKTIQISGGNGSETCTETNSYIFQDFAGGRHDLHLQHITTADTDQCNTSANFAEIDTGGDLYTHAQLISPPVGGDNDDGQPVVADADGTVYTFGTGGGNWGCSPSATNFNGGFPSTIEDRNGNVVSVSNDCKGNLAIQDTLNRSLLTVSAASASTIDIAVAGLARPYVITLESFTINGFTSNTTSVGANTGCASIAPLQAGISYEVIKSITLPDLTSYSFEYDTNIGEVSQITYPNGGYVSYKWGTNPQSNTLLYSSVNTPGGNGCIGIYDTPAITERTVSFDGVTTALTQDFNPFGPYVTTYDSDLWKTKQTTVKTVDHGLTYFTQYNYVPGPLDGALDPLPVEKSIVSEDANQALIQTTYQGWTSDSLPPLCTVIQTGSLLSGTFYQYGAGGVTSDKREYDYGQLASPSVCPISNSGAAPSTTPKRETVTTYHTFPVGPLYPGAPTILGRPDSVIVKSAGTAIKETDYGYDSAVSNVTATSHDPLFGTALLSPRGNVASVTEKCLQGCSTSSTTTLSYDITGQLVSQTDPCGSATCADMAGQSNHTTSYGYTDSSLSGGSNPAGNSNAYLTSAILTAASTGAALTQSYSYNYANGTMSKSTDENGQIISYSYNDTTGLGRLSDVYYPASSQRGNTMPHTQYSYADGEGAYVEVSSPIGGTVTTRFDGMGRAISKETSYGGAGVIQHIDTTYTGSGLVQSVSNPYFSTGDPTYGITSFLYDALGRQTAQCNADNAPSPSTVCEPTSSYETWTYNGSSTTHTNSLGNTWQSAADGLGRLVAVTEPGGLATSYTYDALDNLTGVQQSGKSGDTPRASRSFTYDSLSRLTCSSNPESGQGMCPITGTSFPSGATQYGYDANGNLSSKTFPSPESLPGSGSQTTTTFSYDSLNRLLSKTSSGFLSECFQYDGAIPNGKGRLTNEWTSSAACSTSLPTAGAASGIVSARSILGYDEVGRTTAEQQCVTTECAANAYGQLSYGYDLAGNGTGLTSNIGANGAPLALIYNFDPASHLTSVVSNWTASNPANLYTLAPITTANTSGYGPVGPQLWNLGASQSNYTVNESYTNRLRVNAIKATGQLPQ